jgi:hypothetical protein
VNGDLARPARDSLRGRCAHYQKIRAHSLHALEHTAFRPFPDGHHHDDSGDADQKARHTERRPQAVSGQELD